MTAAGARSELNKVFAVAYAGIIAVFRNNWVRRGIILTLLSAAGWSFLLLILVSQPKFLRDFLKEYTSNVLYFRFLNDVIMRTFVAFLIGLAGTDLISADIRNRTFPVYFTRGLKPQDYVLGKFLTLFFYACVCVLIPALFVFSSAVGTQLEIEATTADHLMDLIGVVLNFLMFSIPVIALVLFFSSLSSSPYTGAISYFLVYFGVDGAVGALVKLSDEKMFGMASIPDLIRAASTLCYEDRVGWKAHMGKQFNVYLDPYTSLAVLAGITLAFVLLLLYKARKFRNTL